MAEYRALKETDPTRAERTAIHPWLLNKAPTWIKHAASHKVNNYIAAIIPSLVGGDTVWTRSYNFTIIASLLQTHLSICHPRISVTPGNYAFAKSSKKIYKFKKKNNTLMNASFFIRLNGHLIKNKKGWVRNNKICIYVESSSISLLWKDRFQR